MQATPRPDAPPTPTIAADALGVCSACAAKLRNAAVCEACGALNRNPVPFDPFAMLGFPAAFELDAATLNNAYRAIARRVHPDRFTNADDETQALASRISAHLNHAQQVLADPLRRADCLLVRAGGPTAAELREVPGDLLVETMTLREELEEAKSRQDAAALSRIREGVVERRRMAMQRIANGASKLPHCDASEMTELRRQLNAMKYYDNLLAETA